MYAYVWDLTMDWDLIQERKCSDKHFLLRKYITFTPKRNYYIVMVTNLILRLAWTLSLSPAVIGLFGDKNLLTFATGTAEIMRRGFWNLFRVEKEHLANC